LSARPEIIVANNDSDDNSLVKKRAYLFIKANRRLTIHKSSFESPRSHLLNMSRGLGAESLPDHSQIIWIVKICMEGVIPEAKHLSSR
jgi:hypothetical protein